MATQDGDPRTQTLLTQVVGKVFTLLLLLCVFLFGSAWLHTRLQGREEGIPDISGLADSYSNDRLLAALQTFEHAIKRIPADGSAGVSVAVMPNAETLLKELPACAPAWREESAGIKGLRSSLRGKAWEPRYVARDVAQDLVRLDSLVSSMNPSSNRPERGPLKLDLATWFKVLNERIGHPIQIHGQNSAALKLQCVDIPIALHQLIREDGQLLRKLSWRDTTVASATAKWRPDQIVGVSSSLIMRNNPWLGVPGCVFFRDATRPNTVFHVAENKQGRNRAVCEQEEVSGTVAGSPVLKHVALAKGTPDPERLDDPRWKVPPSLSAMLQPLNALRMPASSLFRKYTEAALPVTGNPVDYRYGPNRISIGGNEMDVGFSLDLTIQPETQALAQQVATCYTGNQGVCRQLGIYRVEDGKEAIGHKLLEKALVRMAGVAIIDISTGRIEALAGALSPCNQQGYAGPGLATGCDRRLPWRPGYHPDLLLNPAVFHDAMPASTIKPIMAAAFLTDGAYGKNLQYTEEAASRSGGKLGAMQQELKQSASKAFLGRMFCGEKGYRDCDRPWSVQRAANELGWNPSCVPGSAGCGRFDLLFGRVLEAPEKDADIRPLALPMIYGRLMVEPSGGQGDSKSGFGVMKPHSPVFSAELVRACAQSGWERCKGEHLVNLVAEGWGQGNARTTAVGVAGMMARLGAAANGLEAVRRPYFVADVRGVRGSLQLAVNRWQLDTPTPVGVQASNARIILGGLAYSHRGGTASLACKQTLGEKTCAGAVWIAGKTGTPSFRNDKRGLDEIDRICNRQSADKAGKQQACANLRPYKWYTAVYRVSDGQGSWEKAIAVLTERNWLQDSGRVHGAGDNGPNPAAEMAFQIVSRQRDRKVKK